MHYFTNNRYITNIPVSKGDFIIIILNVYNESLLIYYYLLHYYKATGGSKFWEQIAMAKTRNLLGVDLKCSHHRHTQKANYMRWWIC